MLVWGGEIGRLTTLLKPQLERYKGALRGPTEENVMNPGL